MSRVHGDLAARAEAIRWYHTIDLGGGVVTKGIDDSALRLARLDLPQSLAGLTVLDIGAWDGFFSFEAERRGAARVVAADYFSWHGDGWGSKAGFELARAGARIEGRGCRHRRDGSLARARRPVRRRLLSRRPLSPAASAPRARAHRVGHAQAAHPRDRRGHGRHRAGRRWRSTAAASSTTIRRTGGRRTSLALHAMLRDVGFADVRTVTPEPSHLSRRPRRLASTAGQELARRSVSAGSGGGAGEKDISRLTTAHRRSSQRSSHHIHPTLPYTHPLQIDNRKPKGRSWS